MSEVLFVCVHNAGRSQMAKALFNAGADRLGMSVRAESAGTIPGDHLHPEVVEAMREKGIDVSGETPKLMTDDMLEGNPRIFTMGCAVDSQACPSLRLENVVDWGLPDPKGQPIEDVRKIRDDIERRVEALLAEIKAAPTQA